MKEEKGNEDLSIEGTIAIVFTAMLDDVAETEDQTGYVTDIVAATSDDIAAITGSLADLTKMLSNMSSKIERLEAQNSELSNQNKTLIRGTSDKTRISYIIKTFLERRTMISLS